MPHIIFEYSQNTFANKEQSELLDCAFEAVESTGLFNADNIKVRLHPVENYRLGLKEHGFMHVICRIHQGRSVQHRVELSQAMLTALSKLMSSKLVITVEVVEMERASYAKKVV